SAHHRRRPSCPTRRPSDLDEGGESEVEREYRTGDREEGDGTGAHRGADAPPRHHARSTDTSQHVISGNKSTRTLIISGTDPPRRSEEHTSELVTRSSRMPS